MVERDRRLTDRLAFVGSLAAGLAHEIKNPLSTIKINLELLAEEWAAAESPREKRTLAKVKLLEREVRRLEDVVAEFLRYARGGDLEVRPTDLTQVVRETLDFVRPELRRASITLQEFLEEGEIQVPLDAARFKQALLNLLINAREATASGGSIVVRLAREGREVVLEITDSGTGIPADVLEQIWQPYFSTKQGGTGLGLPMSRRILDELGGTIILESEPGRGTRARIRMPLEEGL